MALTFNSFLSEIATLTAISSNTLLNGDANFPGIFSGLIDYAEGRLYRDLDLPVLRQLNGISSAPCSTSTYTYQIPSSVAEPLVIEQVCILTPASVFSSGTLLSSISYTINPLVPVSIDVLDGFYSPTANLGVPQYYARYTNVSLAFGPAPDQPYGIVIRQTVRPTPLSSANPTTWLSLNIPELMVCAGMVFASAHMRNFGAQSDNPQMSQSWENQYNTLKQTMNQDALRMKFQSQGWTQQVPNPIATPPRA